MARTRKAPRPRLLTAQDQLHIDCDYVPPYDGFTGRYVARMGGTETAASAVEKQVEQDIAASHGYSYPAQVSGTEMNEAKEAYLVSLGA